MADEEERRYHLDPGAHAEFILGRINEGVLVVDRDLRVLSVNRYLLDLVGSTKDAIGKKCHQEFFESPDPCPQCPAITSFETGEPANCIHRCCNDHKEGVHVHHQAFPVVSSDGGVEVVIETVRDVSELMDYRRKLEGHATLLEQEVVRRTDELRRLQEVDEMILDASPVGYILIDRDLRVVRANRSYEVIAGYDHRRIEGERVEDFMIDGPRKDQILDRLRGALDSGEVQGPTEIEQSPKSGRYVRETIFPITDQKGQVAMVLGVLEDVTERREAQEDLRKSEGKFRGLAEGSPNMIFINRGGKVVYANRRCQEVMGHTVEEFLSPGFDFMSIIAPESREAVLSNLKRHQKGQEVEPYEYSLITKGGERLDAIHTTKLIEYEGAPAILGIVTDITDRKKAEAELMASEERFRGVFEKANDAIFMVDTETGRIIGANKKAEDLLGIPRERIQVMHHWEIHPPEDAEMYKEGFRRAIEVEQGGPPLGAECYVQHASGMNIPVEINSTNLSLDGRRVRIGIFRDITERKRWEETLQGYADQVEEANHAKDLFADILRHDLMNNIQIINMFLEPLEGEVDPTPDTEEYFGVIRENLSKATDLVEDATTFSKLETTGFLDLERLDIQQLVEHARVEMRQLYGGEAERILIRSSGDHPIKGNLILTQVFSNLFSNALKYTPGGSSIEVDIEDRGDRYLIMVMDRGDGIPGDMRERIFERFKRGEKAGIKGTGLGLAIARQVVDLHGGRIWVEDNKIEYTDDEGLIHKEKCGSIFYVSLPKERPDKSLP